MNVEIGTETTIFLFWEYLFQNFGILSLQCGAHLSLQRTSKMVQSWMMLASQRRQEKPSGLELSLKHTIKVGYYSKEGSSCLVKIISAPLPRCSKKAKSVVSDKTLYAFNSWQHIFFNENVSFYYRIKKFPTYFDQPECSVPYTL